MKQLSIDIETFSSADLKKSGVYRYSEAPDFEVLLFGYAADGGPVRVVDLASGETLPLDIREALLSSAVTKWAFNAQFERVCLSHHLGAWLDPASWRCTMVWAATLGLPLSLEGVGTALGLQKQKLKEGKKLVAFFGSPCKPTYANGGRIRNLPAHAPEKWEAFRQYSLRDVEAERGIQEKLGKFPVPEVEWENYVLDQRINDRGIQLDLPLVRQAIACARQARTDSLREARSLTGLANPNSTQQLKEWLRTNGVNAASLNKAAVGNLLTEAVGSVEQVLLLRRELSKSSVKKYVAMENAVCADGRAHGLLQFYGANRTGRFAGRLIQVQNLPQNHLPDLEQARALVRQGQFGMVAPLYDSVPAALSELIRTAFIPRDGCRFFVADFSAIEARVIAWLAGETWRNEVFTSHGKIYEASASQMFHVPMEQVTKGSPLRQKGKIAELALGYGGSVGALTAMGALGMGVPEAELLPLVKAWRAANPNIVKLWWNVDAVAIEAVRDKKDADLPGLRFSYQSGVLFIRLPSGRRLAYARPRVEKNRFDKDAVTYEGIGEAKKWGRIQSYGPKFVENIVQGTARDLLTDAMRRLDARGYRIVMHVHDEVVIEAPPDTRLEEICAVMAETPPWAQGLQLCADGYVCDFYKKE